MARSTKVTIGGEEKTIYDFSGRKGVTALRIVRSIGEAWPKIVDAQAKFRREYEDSHAVVLDRSQAVYQLSPERLERMTDEDWEKSDNKLRLSASPSPEEVWGAVFPLVFDEAEEQTMQLVGLCMATNQEVRDAARRGGKPAVIEFLEEKSEDVLDDASAAEIMEVLVVAAELIYDEFREKLDKLGDRVGKLRGLVGLKDQPAQTSDPDETTSRTPSSSASPESSDGTRSEPSTGTPSTVSSVSASS